MSGPKLELVPKLVKFVTVLSRVYWNAMVGNGREVAGNVECDGGSSFAVKT